VTFPETPLPIRAEMLIDGTWTEITSDVRSDDATTDIVIRGGFAPEQTALSASSISFAINNAAGLYSDDNPASAYYGLLPTGTPFRVSIEEAAPFLYLPNGLNDEPIALGVSGWEIGWAETADKAVLDVVGDLDLRIEVEPDQWQLGSAGQQLAGKYWTSAQRSWAWTVQANGCMRLYWSADGASPLPAGTYADCTEAVPGNGRIALRVTIDVNNGAAGRDITFYTSDSITGSWTQLGSTVTQAGTTSIFSSTAILTVGAIGNVDDAIALVSDPTFGYTLPLVGRVYRFQMRSGIGGTLVADMNATAQAEGTTSWSDGLGTPNTWTLAESAEITKADYRGYAEIAEMPQTWDPTGADVFIPTQAAGIVRRITQGGQSIGSSIFRYLRQYIGAGAVGYWTLEGGSQSTAAGNAVPGQRPAVVENVLFSRDTEFPASAGVMTLNDSDSHITGSVTGAAASDQATIIFYYKIDAAPASDTNTVHMYLSGTCRQVTFSVSATNYRIAAYDATGTSLGNTGGVFGANTGPGQWLAVQMRANKNGTGVDLNLAWYPLGTQTTFLGLSPLTIASATVGAITGFATSPGIASAGLNATFAHFMLLNVDGFEFATAAFSRMSLAFTGEYAAERWLRLLREEGVEGRCVGWPADTITMGPQQIDTLTTNLTDCAVTSGSLQYEARDMAALVFRTYRSLLVQQPVELTYPKPAAHLSGQFRPTIDDLGLKNAVTASSPGGAFAVASKETGPRSIATAGRYDSPITVNPETDEQLPGLAQFAVFLGTWPDRRVPNLEVWLERQTFVTDAELTRQMRSLNPGDRVRVSDVPVWVGGGASDTLIRGYVETLGTFAHRLAFSTVPYGPYRAVSDLSASVTRRAAPRYGGSLLTSGINSSALSMSVTTATGKTWGTTAGKPGNFPLDIMMGGEQITVSGIGAPAAGVQLFTLSARSVNGVSKAHSAGAIVTLVDEFYVART
jgi:hypothetical protein